MRSESNVREPSLGRRRPPYGEVEHVRCDPKDGELCPGKAKPGETLVEACSDSDVQIDRATWV